MNPARWIEILVGFAFATAAVAKAPAADPASAGSPAPPLRYQSAFAGYKGFDDAKVGNWREVNDRVRDAAAGQAAGHGSGALPSPGAPAGPAGNEPVTRPKAPPPDAGPARGSQP